MSVSLKLEMFGDLDNPAHREVAKKIVESIQSIVKARDMYASLYVTEEKMVQTFAPLSDEPKQSGTSQKIIATCGFA